MADEIIIETTSAEVIEVGVPGPQGATGPKGDPGDVAGLPLTTQGDTLYRGASENQRLPIGTSGQILKVSSGGIPEWGAAPVTGVTSVTGTAPITSSGGNTPAISISEATTSAAGSMSAADKLKLDGIAAGAEVNVNADWNASSGDAQILNKPTLGGAAALNVGTTTGTVAAGDDSRLSDSRTPTAHAASHAASGSDPVSPASIGAQSIFATDDAATNTGTLTASRAKIWSLSDFTNSSYNLKLPRTNAQVGDIVVIRVASNATWGANSQVTIGYDFEDTPGVPDFFPLITISQKGVQYRYQCTTANSFGASYTLIDVDTHTHTPAQVGLGNVSNTAQVTSVSGSAPIVSSGGTTPVISVTTGTTAGTVAAGNHTHTQLHDRSHAITSTSDHTAGNHKVFYSNGSGEIVELALGSSGTVLTSNGATSAPSFAAASGGVSAIGASAADILSVSGSDLVADDPNADRLVFWDDSAGALKYLTAGSGLTITDTTIAATASGGSKTYAVFSAEHNQPPSTAFATLDTRNSIAVLDFDDATDESAVFVGIIPEGASLGSGLKIRLHWMATTATSGNCVWDVSLERMTTDLDSDSFDTIASATAAANGTSGILTVTEITLTTIDSVTAGDGFRLKVTRDANNASDTMSGDAELVVCEVRSAA